MLLTLPNILSREELAQARVILEAAEWVDGRVTAGHQSVEAKNNLQIPERHPAALQLGEMILKALSRNSLFFSAALPLHVFPPLFNRYSGGHSFGTHVDNAIRQVSGAPLRIRTDLSVTLFFSEPEEYDGGELMVEDTYGSKSVKLPAGHLVLYPATSLHHVTPVSRGTRTCSFFWIQSMVRDDSQRSLLLELDQGIRRLASITSETDAIQQSSVQLTGVYHNLLRRWAEV
jgi:PKHD-type hydroxylase